MKRDDVTIGDATETFAFTPINAMRSLENVELSAERTRKLKEDVVNGDGKASITGKRRVSGDGDGDGDAREASASANANAALREIQDERGELENDSTKARTVVSAMMTRAEDEDQGLVSEFTFTVAEEDARRATKTFWASGATGISDVKKATFAPLMHTNGLPPTPAVYSAVPWPSSIPLRERSPPRVGGNVNASSVFATPDDRRFEQRRANVSAVTHNRSSSSLVLESIATTPNELAVQLAHVKQEIANRQNEAMEVSRVLRQLQRDEADLYIRAAEIQRQILEKTSENQPFDLSIMPSIAPPSRNIETMVSLERSETLARQHQGTAAGDDAEPSTSKTAVNNVKAMKVYQKLDVRKALISVDFIDGPGGLSLLTASVDNCLRLWAPDSRKPAALMRAPRGMTATAIMNERMMCVGTDAGQIVQVDIATGQHIGALTHGEHGAPWSVKTLTKFGVGTEAVIAAAGTGGDIKIWDARAARGGGAPAVMYSHGATEIRSVSFAPDGRTVVAAASNDLRSFDLRMNGRSMRMSVAAGLQPSWTAVKHNVLTGEAVTLSSAGDAHVWSAAAPFPLSKTLCGASAPKSSVIDVSSNFMLCAKSTSTSALEMMDFSTGAVVAAWYPTAHGDVSGAVSCVAVSTVGVSTQPYGLNHIAAGTFDGAVLVLA